MAGSNETGNSLAGAYDRLRQRLAATARESADAEEAKRRAAPAIVGNLRLGDRVFSRIQNQHGTITSGHGGQLFGREAAWVRLDTGTIVLVAVADLVPLPSRPPAGGAGTP